MRNKPLYYLAHPYIDDPEENYKKSLGITEALLTMGFAVINPLSLSHGIEGTLSEHDWLRFGKVIIQHCDGLILAPGWETSFGCLRELELASSLSLTIIKYEDLIGKCGKQLIETLA